MDSTEKSCVLAIDNSGSVSGCHMYWEHVEKILNEAIAKGYSSIKILAWNSSRKEITVDILRGYIKQCRGQGGTSPELVWGYLLEQSLHNYDLSLVTDGEIYDGSYNQYVSEYNRLSVKPENIQMYYIGYLNNMNMKFLDCFAKCDYKIHGYDTNNAIVSFASTKIGKDSLLDQLLALEEFKEIEAGTENVQVAMVKLRTTLYRKIGEYSQKELDDDVGVVFKKFVDRLNKVVHQKYIDVDKNSEAARFDDLFDNYKLNSKAIFNAVIDRLTATISISYRKELSQIIELGNGQVRVDRRLTAYGENWYERAKEQAMRPTNNDRDDDDDDPDEMDIDEDDQNKANDDTNKTATNSSASCPILMLDSSEYSKYCVVWIGVDDVFGGANFKLAFDIETRRKIAKAPLRLFEFLSHEKLNQKVPPAEQHISIDAFMGLESIQLDSIGAKHFKRVYRSPIHQVPCFGIILHNADSKAIDWPTKMSQNEKNILLHNYATVTQLLFGDSKFVGSFALLHTFFLYILHQCDRVDPYIKACIMVSIRRFSSISQCRIMLQSGLEPVLTTFIKNAIIFHTAVYPVEIEKMDQNVPGVHSLNILRKHIQYINDFMTLAKDAYGVEYNKDFWQKLKLWRLWNHMLAIENMSNEQKSLYFKQIALSKIQNWVPIDSQHVKIMFIEGKSTSAYFDYLNDVDYEEIVKLIVLFEKYTVKTANTNISTRKIKLAKSGEWYNIQPIEKIQALTCNVFSGEFCKASCAFPTVCPYTKLPRTECYENQKFSLCDYGYPDNNSTTFAHSYVKKCNSLILAKSAKEKRMQIPSVDELKMYIVKKTPLVVYHSDIDQILDAIVEKYSVWYEWYENANDHEKQKYLWIHSDWKKILDYRAKNDHDNRLGTCDCEAHAIPHTQIK